MTDLEARISTIRDCVAKCGYASSYFAPSVGQFASPGGIKPRYLPENKLLHLFHLLEKAGLHIEQFCDATGNRHAWITDQSRGPVPAIPAWAKTRGWS